MLSLDSPPADLCPMPWQAASINNESVCDVFKVKEVHSFERLARRGGQGCVSVCVCMCVVTQNLDGESLWRTMTSARLHSGTACVVKQ